MPAHRAILLLACLTLARCASRRADPVVPVTPSPVPPALVVTLVVDQFAAWVADARLPLLPDDGGFARLRREGTWFHHAEHPYAVTDTAPGHAMLYTGRPPRETGIFANETLDARGSRISILRDDATRLVGPTGVTTETGSSIARLRVDTLADELRARRPESVIVSVSLKDRAAIFGGGRHSDATLWFDPPNERLVTSTAWATVFPAWAVSVGSPDAVRALRATPWVPLDATWVAAHAATADLQPGESDLDGWGTTFPHDFARAASPGRAMRASPRGDDLVLAAAVAAVERVRNPNAPMLLAVSLSSNDYIGHLFGPDSWEQWDELRQLDASLARFFRALDRLVGAAQWAVVLSADHGTITLPEAQSIAGTRPLCARGVERTTPYAYEWPCRDGEIRRILPDQVAVALQAASVSALGPGTWVLGVADPWVFLTPEAEALPAERRAVLLDALRARLRSYPEIAGVYEARATPASCPPASDVSIDALVCRSIPSHAEGDLYMVTARGAFFDANYVVGFGSSHGSPFHYDRTVPILVRAPGRTPAGRSVETLISTTAFHDTAAALLGLAVAR